jgi:hypothetical protein
LLVEAVDKLVAAEVLEGLLLVLHLLLKIQLVMSQLEPEELMAEVEPQYKVLMVETLFYLPHLQALLRETLLH